MKKYLSIFFAIFIFSATCFAQDEIIFHNGNTAKGKVLEVSDYSIKFVYEGEDAAIVIGNNAIAEIKFESGRVQEMSPKIDIQSPDDWEKVRVVTDKEEVLGLKSLGQVEKHSSGTWSFALTGGHFSEKTLKKVRKEAANRGGCIVLIINQQSKSGGLFSDGHASMSGEIYTY